MTILYGSQTRLYNIISLESQLAICPLTATVSVIIDRSKIPLIID